VVNGESCDRLGYPMGKRKPYATMKSNPILEFCQFEQVNKETNEPTHLPITNHFSHLTLVKIALPTF
jgi:hypothetical protein